jgi:hypothetical protein
MMFSSPGVSRCGSLSLAARLTDCRLASSAPVMPARSSRQAADLHLSLQK